MILFLARFLQWSLTESLSSELCLLKSLLTGPLNRTGKAGSCPTRNNFIELWSINFPHINTPDGYDTPTTEIHYSTELKDLAISQEEYTRTEGSSMLEWSLQAPSHESRGYSHHEELAWDAKFISPWTALMNLHNSFKSACNLMHQILSLPFPVSLSAYPFRPLILVINLSN